MTQEPATRQERATQQEPSQHAAETDAALLPVSGLDATQPDGSVRGYRASRTLPVRVELARQLKRRRTRFALGFLALLPLLLLAAFEIGDAGSARRASGELVDLATGSGLNFAMYALYSSAPFLLVVIVALFFGDTVASEASWRSLKYLLAAPVPRARLLRQKALVAALLSLCGLVLLPAIALAVGVFWYGPGDLVSPSGSVVPFPLGALDLVLAVAFLAVHLSWVAGLALCLSVRTDAPLGAVGGAVVLSILSQILDQISALGGLRAYLPTHYATSWTGLLGEGPEWAGVVHGACSGVIYAAVFTALALWHFHHKDVTS
ncbi:MAG: ABC transporter permease [Saccharopolyspora sp.]|uniref:ABC transporter permease n=1 Tax=unclassified Saccharopolyspora TaxID=2646250 RepID=UPI0025CDD3DF|nr:ABC transporter permease [Saccharopolyspora sp.]MBQ6644708.1 ABC transporter permease [Saccharopolyspora sp.]